MYFCRMLHVFTVIGAICTFVYIAYEITFVDTQTNKKEPIFIIPSMLPLNFHISRTTHDIYC